MSRGVDVLAVMDRALSACEAHTSRTVYVGGEECFKRISDNYGLSEARAAVAELIEASECFWRATDFGRKECSYAIAKRFETAVDRVKGGAA